MSTQLNKTFSERDLQRMRNIISKKTGEGTRIQAGYNKTQITYSEGDIWEENGKTWTMKNGLKQTVTKHDALKAMVEFPLNCPCCSKPMKDFHLNRKMYNIHQKCFDCVIEFETELRRTGKWEEYQTAIQNAEIDGYISNLKSWVEDELTLSNNSFVTENGDVERWVGDLDKEKVKQSLDESIEYLESLKK
jgi:hypothetical protein